MFPFSPSSLANICWIIKKAREFQKNIYFCFINYAKAFDCANHNKLWETVKEMGISDHLTCLLRNLYSGQEATIRTGHGTTDWFKIGKGVHQSCILSSCLFNFYAQYIMSNVRLDESQSGFKIAWRNINNLKYADDTTLMAESKEEIKSLLTRVKEESEKAGLKIQHSKNEDHDIQSHHFMANRWGSSGNSDRLHFWGSKITADGDCSHEIKRCLFLGKKVMTTLDSILKSRDITLTTGPSSQSYGFSSSHVKL